MATNEEIIKTLKDNLADGIVESQFADRRERKLTPKEIAEGLRALQGILTRSKQSLYSGSVSGVCFGMILNMWQTSL